MLTRRTLVMAIGAGLGRPASASGQSKQIRHGQVLRADRVGPAAAGYAVAAVVAGVTIRDDTTAPYLRRIESTRAYDGFVVLGPHLLIEGVAFSSPLDVYATLPLVLRGVDVRIMGASYWGVLSRAGAGTLTVLWSSLGGARATSETASIAKPGVQRGLYLESDNAVVYRSHIAQVADGIQVHAPGARVIETLIDDLATWPGEHNDGIQVIGRGERLTVQRSRIVNPHAQTSCLLLQRGGHVIENNYLSGGGWVIYGAATAKPPDIQPARDVRVTGNIFGQERSAKSGTFGAIADWDGSAASGNVWRDNLFADGRPAAPSAPNR